MESIYWDLMAKYFSSNISTEEEKELFAWVKDKPENEIIFKQAKLFWDSSINIKVKDFDPDTEKAWKNLKEEILAERSDAKVHSIKPVAAKVKYFMIAASLVLIIGIGYLLSRNSFDISVSEEIAVTDIITTTDIVTTDHMEFYYLPDSSKIWLNKNSTLKYSKDFLNERTVSLEGEAFFDVQKDASHPFIINTENASTKVLGTSFNFKAYKEAQDIQIVVVSGVVEVFAEGNDKMVLEKGDKGIVTKGNRTLKKEKNNDSNVFAWRNNKEEIKKTKKYQEERVHSVTYLLNDFKWSKNLIKQTVLEGEIYNSAIFTAYENVKLKVIYYDQDKKEQAVSYFTVNQAVNPGVSIKYKHRLYDWFKDTRSVKIEISDAEVLE